MATQLANLLIEELTKISIPSNRLVNDNYLAAEARGMAERGYVFDDTSLNLLRTYLSTKAGLLLQGRVGTGKTFFFKARGIPILSMQRASSHSLGEIEAALKSRHDEEILIDDIGAEGDFNNYGVKMDILSVIIASRLDTLARTHFTTNLTPEEIYTRYGARTFDRLKELAKMVPMTGESKRKADGARIIAEDAFAPRLWQACAARCNFYDEASRCCTRRVKAEPRDIERCPHF